MTLKNKNKQNTATFKQLQSTNILNSSVEITNRLRTIFIYYKEEGNLAMYNFWCVYR